MRFFADYDRSAAVLYAHQWAYGRNPAFYDYENVGGDCTNFASQCVFAGSGVMNFTPDFGWYYIDANQKSPSWTGVPYFWNFMTRQAPSVGPVAQPCALEDLQPGDLAELQRPGVPAYAGGGAGDGAHHPGDGTDRRPQLRRRQPAPVHLHVPGHPVSARTGHHPALGNRLRKMNRENRLGGSASQPVSFCFFLDFFTCDKGFAFAAIRRDSLSMWV